MKFLITRPLEQSKRFSSQLVEVFGENIKVCISPVIEINTLKQSINTKSFQGLLFTSENGVRAFAKLSIERNLPAFCVGNQTALVARSCGFLSVSAQGDTNRLILLLKDQASELRLLYLRGKYVSADIEQELRKDNIKVVSKIVYDQTPMKLTHQAVQFLSGSDGVIVPLFSDRSNVILSKQFFQEMNSIRIAICLSPAIARNVNPLHYSKVYVSPNPNSVSLIEEIKRFTYMS